MTILVTGSTGAIGSRVVAGLVAANADFRALARTPEKAKLPGAKIIKGDFDQPEAIARALDDITSVLLLTPPDPADFSMVERFLEIALKSPAAPRIVRLSAIRATEGGPSDGARSHGRADRAILESGLPYAILRPNYFMQNLLGSAESILANGKLINSTGNGRLGFIDVRDIADVAIAVLLDRGWDGGIYDLTGPATLSFDDVARELSAALDREISCIALTPEQMQQAVLQKSGSAWFAGIMRDYATAYARGWGDFTTSFVQKITGRPARSVAQFAREVFVPALQGAAS